MGFLGREELLQTRLQLPVERVDLPERNGHVFVRVMTGAERGQFEMLFDRAQKANAGFFPDIRQAIAAFTLCDEQGGRLFTADEIDAVGEMDSLVLDRVFPVAMRINKLTAEEVQALTKNSSEEPTVGIGSNSRAN